MEDGRKLIVKVCEENSETTEYQDAFFYLISKILKKMKEQKTD